MLGALARSAVAGDAVSTGGGVTCGSLADGGALHLAALHDIVAAFHDDCRRLLQDGERSPALPELLSRYGLQTDPVAAARYDGLGLVTALEWTASDLLWAVDTAIAAWDAAGAQDREGLAAMVAGAAYDVLAVLASPAPAGVGDGHLDRVGRGCDGGPG